ncbi:MAG TPA: type II CAAX endopeptidase family protein [Armatimonadota bacterium]|mgnify:CR=1 FL=1|nr:type II CAAX endopeptidase family protein [Armatimonadota bacterium]HPP73956.1 type II CAAX endopeptidase family protein [Armatimonadota bacterium]
MPDVGTWAKLAAYVVCIGLVLEFAHRLYWQLNGWAMNSSASAGWRAFFSAIFAAIPLFAVLLVTGAFCIYIDRQPLYSLGLQSGFDSFLMFSEGAAVAFVAVTFLFLAGYSIGWFKIERASISGDNFPAFCGGACDFSLAAVFEEVAIRGYVFSVLQHSWGSNVAVVGSAVVFSLLHLIKHPKIPLVFTINAFIFGILTAQARLITGSLWVPIGLHFGWNFAMGPVFGLPCGGRKYEHGLVISSVNGPEWMTGGLYSPDAGVLGTGALTVTAAVMLALMPVG